MRNNQLNTQLKETIEKSEETHHEGDNLAKNSQSDKTELTIQTIFTLAIIANFYTFIPTLHVAALIILFKCLTNFPRESKTEEQDSQSVREHTRPKKHTAGWKRRKKQKWKPTWTRTKWSAKLILAILTGTYISDTLVKYGSPNSPRQTLYSLAHDTRIVNLPGSAFPIKRATTNRNKTKIRNDIKNMITSMLKLLGSTQKIIQDIINVRNKNIRTLIKAAIKKCYTLCSIHCRGCKIGDENKQTLVLRPF